MSCSLGAAATHELFSGAAATHELKIVHRICFTYGFKNTKDGTWAARLHL